MCVSLTCTFMKMVPPMMIEPMLTAASYIIAGSCRPYPMHTKCCLNRGGSSYALVFVWVWFRRKAGEEKREESGLVRDGGLVPAVPDAHYCKCCDCDL
jgi:hypothetical protein